MKNETNHHQLYQQQIEHNKFIRAFYLEELKRARLTIQVLAEEIRRRRLYPEIRFLNQN